VAGGEPKTPGRRTAAFERDTHSDRSLGARITHPPTRSPSTIRARGMPHATRTHPAPNDAIFLPFAPHLTSIISRPCRRQSLSSPRQLRRRPRAEFFTGCKSAHQPERCISAGAVDVPLAVRLISSPEEEERLFDASS